MMRFKLSAILLTVISSQLISSQAQAFDLLQAWQSAHTQDPLFGVARASAEAGKTKSLQAQALKRPQVTANLGMGGINSNNEMSNAQFSAPGMGAASGASFRTQTNAGVNTQWNIRAEYPLYDVARFNSASQLNKQAELAEVQLSNDEQQLMLRVAQAYFDTLLAADTLATLQSQQAAVKEALASAKERFKEGDLAIIDTHETQARFDLLAAAVLEAESHLQLTRAILADMSGHQEAVLAALPPKVDLQDLKAGELAEWLERAKNNNVSLHTQLLQQDIAREETQKHLAFKSPQLNLVAQAGGQRVDGLGSHDANLNSHQLNLGLQLTIPLYTGGMRDARYQEALALADKAQYQVEATRQQATREARSAWLALSVGQSQVKALQQAEHSAEIKLDSTRLGRDVGDRTTLDVLNSEQELYNTRLTLYRSRYQVLLALLNLSATAGELNETRLQQVNQLLSPE
ncbi:MAG: TolC family outer membrane protein [Methylophilaceae bacterium]